MIKKIAILVDKKDLYPPSNLMALNYFKKIAHDHKTKVDFLNERDFNKLASYSGLFVRTLMSLNHFSYNWIEFAEYLKLNVIDTTKGISLGANKHLQYELCQWYDILTPKTKILYRHESIYKFIESCKISFPLVIKIPDGYFSKGVYLIENKKKFIEKCKNLFKSKYYTLIIQEYLYSSFDWRIGILNKKPLFACKYFMVENHWQILKYIGDKMVEGEAETISIRKIPNNILNLLSKVVLFLDHGFYGIDIKEINGKVYLIEINDNPNLYFGVEDKINRDEIFYEIFKSLTVPLSK